ncbi:hypothetical protein ACH4SK_30960 [Streptomyces inhibens]|uniref:hypothetical protein n=1 Tax=Streptomyces inhibens TaxID=2293571 RepID=UPI0037A3012E
MDARHPLVPVVPDVVPDVPDAVPAVPDVPDVVPDVAPVDVAAIALHPVSASGPQGGGVLGVVPLLPPTVLQPLGNVTILPVFLSVRN